MLQLFFPMLVCERGLRQDANSVWVAMAWKSLGAPGLTKWRLAEELEDYRLQRMIYNLAAFGNKPEQLWSMCLTANGFLLLNEKIPISKPAVFPLSLFSSNN